MRHSARSCLPPRIAVCCGANENATRRRRSRADLTLGRPRGRRGRDLSTVQGDTRIPSFNSNSLVIRSSPLRESHSRSDESALVTLGDWATGGSSGRQPPKSIHGVGRREWVRCAQLDGDGLHCLLIGMFRFGKFEHAPVCRRDRLRISRMSGRDFTRCRPGFRNHAGPGFHGMPVQADAGEGTVPAVA